MVPGSGRSITSPIIQGRERGRNHQDNVIAANPGVLDDDPMTAAPHNVVVVAFDGLQLLDLAGPVEVLRTATRLGTSPPYRTVVATPDGQPVRSESGVSVAPDGSLAEMARSPDRVGTRLAVGGAVTPST